MTNPIPRKEMAVDCNECREQMDVPEELRDDASQAAISLHLASCGSCKRIAEQIDGTLLALKTSALLEPSPRAAQLLERGLAPPSQRAGASSALSARPTSPGMATPAYRPYRRITMMGAAAAAALLVTVLNVPAELDTPGSEIRTKGVRQNGARPSVDLQAMVEHIDADGQVEVEPFEGRAVLGRQEGLLFSFFVEGGQHLLLIERDPNHHFQVLWQQAGISSNQDEATRIDLQGDNGRILRYQPSGPAGSYSYLAVVSNSPLLVTPQLLDELWGRHVEEQLQPLARVKEDNLSTDVLELMWRGE